jgi:U3 small nucleolar RNA-associated protein 12
VCIWNARQASKVAALRPDIANYPYDLPGEVTHIERSTDKTTLAVGYSTGEIRVFNFINKSIVATFKAHRSGVSYLSYDDGNSSSLLASGGKDSDIYIWDMVSMCGVCKLRGHKDVVTSVKFLTKGVQKLLVSVSKDTLLKVWDLSTQYCIQTIVGHRSEIWTMAMFRYPNNHSLLITGSSDSLLRGYAVVMDEEGAEETVHLGDDERVLEHIGCIERQFGLDKCGSIHFNEGGTVIAVQSSGKNVEVRLLFVGMYCAVVYRMLDT